MAEKNNELKVVNIRLIDEPSFYSTDPIHKPEDAVRLMADVIKNYDRETLCVLNMATDGKVVNTCFVHMGTINASMVCPMDVLKSAILSNASRMILIHNHPSGNAVPSENDYLITKRIMESCELVGIGLDDHIVVGGGNGNIFSMREEGKSKSLMPGAEMSENPWIVQEEHRKGQEIASHKF